MEWNITVIMPLFYCKCDSVLSIICEFREVENGVNTQHGVQLYQGCSSGFLHVTSNFGVFLGSTHLVIKIIQ